ncbi:MAG: hypothetical protein ACC645_00910 [Pirellulales bacterium]
MAEDKPHAARVSKRRLGRLRRFPPTLLAWLAAKRIAFVLAAGASLLLALGSTGLWMSFRATHVSVRRAATLRQALEALDRGAHVQAKHLVKEMLRRGNLSATARGGAEFILGVVKLRDTDDSGGVGQTNAYLIAARYLSAARKHGFPAGRQGNGLYQLGKSLYAAQRYTACRDPLLKGLEIDGIDGIDKYDVHRLLSQAYLRDAQPNLGAALRHNGAYLDSPDLSVSARAGAQLERCRILFRLGRMEDCLRVLEQMPAPFRQRGEVLALEGELLLHQARILRKDPALVASSEAEGKARAMYRKAIDVLREVEQHDTLSKEATRRALYLIGVCLVEMGDDFLIDAQQHLARTRKLHFDSPEGLAACLLEADVLRRLHHDQAAVDLYRLALSTAPPPDEYNNPWIPIVEFRSRLAEAYEGLVDARKFAYAEQLIETFDAMFPKIETLQLRAQTARRWADALERDAIGVAELAAIAIQREARKHYRKAGVTYLELAKARAVTRSYPDDLWEGADNLFRGHDYHGALQVFDEYLRDEYPQHRPQALVGMGKAKLALGHIDASVKAFRECIEFHARDAACYQARLWCSKALLEKGENREAEALLLDNLNSDFLTPKSIEWRDSLFALGHLLAIDGRYAQAVEKLSEAVGRYSDAPQAMEGMYTIADAYRQGAKQPQQTSRNAAVQTVRAANRRRARELLEQSYAHYHHVLTRLLEREEQEALTQTEKAMLLNCYFARGSVLFDLERYDEAIEAYSNAATRYQNEPIVLETFVQIANCYRRQNKLVEARGAIEQAKVILKRLPSDKDFTVSTNYSRNEWVTLLNRLSS